MEQERGGADYKSGHLTQMKARFWGIRKCLPQGEIYISEQEKREARRSLGLCAKPLATLQAHGKTIDSPVSDKVWFEIVQELRETHFVIQLKSAEESMILNVDQTITGIRNCIITQSLADVHIGIDSGFTHTAAALDVPCVVILNRISKKYPLVERGKHQMVLPQLKGRRLSFLYPQHSYLCAGPGSPRAPGLNRTTLRMAVDGKIYPFRNQSVWNLKKA